MNVFLLYVVQSALCLSLFYGLYLLLLRREAFFRFNRSVLLAIMVSSMVIPLIRLPVANPALIQFPVMQIEEKISSFGFEVSRWAKPELEAPDPNMARGLGDNPETSATRTTFNVIPLAYLVGFLVSLVLVFVSFVSMARIIVTARPVMYRQQRIFVSPLQISPFTFAGWIVLSEMDYERFAAEIVTHENIHRRRGHFWDLCLVSVITVVHWFNPLVWLLRRELKALHEYEADRSAIAQGIDATRYQLLLIEKAAGASRYSVASSFAQSKIKKRIYMMNKQNLKPRARWKALLFIPPAALMLQAFARPEIKRELEQISTLKSTEILQETPSWTEGKFLEELRKCLPEGVSRDLSHEDTWVEVAKSYDHNGQIHAKGMVLMMNKNGDLMADSKRIVMDDVSGLVKVVNGEKIIKYTLIRRDANAPADAYQKLLNAVGEAYISKRNEMARQYYQTDYKALDAAGKNRVDDLVPMLVMFANPKDMKMQQERGRTSVIYSDSPHFNVIFSGDKMPTEEEWKKAETEFEKINNRQIAYNGQTITVKDLYELLKKDTDGKVRMSYQYGYDKSPREGECKVSIKAPAIDPKDPAYYYLLGGKWVYSLEIITGLIQDIHVYSPDDAVRKYGSKAKNGAIAVITEEYGRTKNGGSMTSSPPPPPPPYHKK